MSQNYVYTVVHMIGNRTVCSLGCYPNFKEAYERVEKLTSKCDYLIDVSNDGYFTEFEFEAITKQKYGRLYLLKTERYFIFQNLLTILPNDKVVSLWDVHKLEAALEKENFRYKHHVDFM